MPVLNSHLDQIGHNIIARANCSGKRTGSFLDQCLGIIKPHVSPVRKPGNADHVGKTLRSCIAQHLHNKVRAKFRKTQRTEVAAADIRRCNPECLGRCKEGDNLRVIHADLFRIDPCKILKHLNHGRIIVPEYIKF